MKLSSFNVNDKKWNKKHTKVGQKKIKEAY